jgi:hypothetical protein
MGLDMYLYKKTNLTSKRWVMDGDSKDIAIVVRNGNVDEHIKPDRVVGVTEEIMYWRKANHIHKWFVDHCADGEDECQEIYVPHDKLVNLVHACIKVVNNHELSEELLPTTSGFFFGSTEYDEWYYESLQEVIDTLLPDLDKGEGDNSYYIYRASW